MDVLTGLGLSTSAGLNAYIPLLTLGLISRFTGIEALPAGWRWLENPWVLGILAVLLAIELVADKVPAVDHANDIIQTVVRPTSGGIVFGATAYGGSTEVTDPASFVDSGAWVPVAVGVVVALLVHLAKAGSRAVVNATTMGVGAPVVSTAEDATAITLSVVALLAPLLVLVLLAVVVLFFGWALRQRARGRARQRTPA